MSASGRHPTFQRIVCPRLRVSPLNAQTEFKVVSMQTAPGHCFPNPAIAPIVRGSVSYRFPLPSSYPLTGALSSPFPCNSGWGSELRFACATVRACIALPMPTTLPPKTGLYDICRHLKLTSETIVFKPESHRIEISSSLSLSLPSSNPWQPQLPTGFRTVASPGIAARQERSLPFPISCDSADHDIAEGIG